MTIPTEIMNPKVSVIIPALNEETTISTSLQAISEQDYPDFEVIVVDNGSTDGTVMKAGHFAVKVVREDRRGTMWACERGRMESSGDIIVRMDADCLPERDWLSRGAAFFADNRVVAVSGPYDYYDAKPFFRYSSRLVERHIYRAVNQLFRIFRARGGVMIGGNSFFRARGLAAAGGFNTAITFYGDDTDTAKRISSQGRIIFDKDLIIKTSARRFKKYGIIGLELRYIYYFLKVLITNHS